MGNVIVSNETKQKIQNAILARPGEYISGNDLGKQFGVSRYVIRREFFNVAKKTGGHIETCNKRGLMYIPAAKKPTVEEEMQKSVDDAVEAFTEIQEKEHAKKDGFTIAEATEYLGLDRSTLYNWMRNGSLKYTTIGRTRYISSEELERIEKERTGSFPRPKSIVEDVKKTMLRIDSDRRLENLEHEILVLRTKVEIYERLIFGEMKGDQK